MTTCAPASRTWTNPSRSSRAPRARRRAVPPEASRLVPLALVLVLLAAMAITAMYGWVIERIAYRPLRGSFRLAPLISAIGMSIFLQNYVQILQGARGKPMPPLVQGGLTIFESGGFAVRRSHLLPFFFAPTL